MTWVGDHELPAETSSTVAREFERDLVDHLPDGWAAGVHPDKVDASVLRVRAVPPGAVAGRELHVHFAVDRAKPPSAAADLAAALVDHYDAEFTPTQMLLTSPAYAAFMGRAHGGVCGCPVCAG